MAEENTADRNLVWNTFDEEAVILDVASGDYFALDAIGTEVWKGLNDGQTVDQIAENIAQKYETDAALVKSDIEELVAELRSAKLWN